MAKLAKSKRSRPNGTSSQRSEPWNLPTSTVGTPSSQKLMPPPARPVQPSNAVMTPSGHKPLDAGARGDNTISAKKKRRRRGATKPGRDSFSDNATTISEVTTNGDTAPPVRNAASLESTMSPPLARPGQTDLRPTISREEQTVYEREPELFGDYAYSVSGDWSSDSEKSKNEKHSNGDKRKDTLAKGPQAAESLEKAIEDTIPAAATSEVNGQHEHLERPQIVSDIVNAQPTTIPPPTKLSSGRFECPFICGKTFGDAKGAKRHALGLHVNAERHKCETCGKGFARKDKYDLHIKSHKGEKTLASKQKATTVHSEKPMVNSESLKSDSANRRPAISGNVQANTQKQTWLEEAEPATVPDVSCQVLDPVTSTESETESEDEDASMNGTTNTTTSAVETKDDVVMQEPSGDETASTLESELEVSPVQEALPNRKNLKRKRPAPSPLSSKIIPSRKRARRNEASNSPEVEESEQEQPVASGAGSSKTSKVDAESRNSALDADIEMPDDEQDTEAGGQSVEESESQSLKLSVRPKPKDKGAETASRRKDTVGISDVPSPDPAEPSASENRRKVKSTSPQPPTRRQSSMDDFVSRSRSTSGQPVRASSSSSKMVNTKTPSRQNTKPQKQAKEHFLFPKQRQAMPKSSKGKERAQGDGNDCEAVKDLAEQKRARRKAKKGKERERESEEEETLEESETHSSDQPRAMTTARRTSSLNSKRRPKLKRTSKIAARLQEGESDGSHSEEQEESDSSADAAKTRDGKPRKSSAQVPTSASGRTGRFSNEEVQILLSWRDSFCAEHDLTPTEFNDVMTATMRRIRDHPWPYKFITRIDFLNQYYEQLPNRNKRSLYRFRERHFQNVETAPWSKEDDNELRGLVNQLGTKWVEIGQLMGRTADAVSQRWKHKLNYGQEVKEGEWTDGEIERLEEEVKAYAKTKGTTARDDDLNIPWHAISLKMGNGRSAQQCSNRWRVNTTRRVKGRFVKVPLEDRLPGSATKAPKPKSTVPKATSTKNGPKTPSKLIQRLAGDDGTSRSKAGRKQSSAKKSFKSAERVDDSDEEADDEHEEKEQAEDETDGQGQDSEGEGEDEDGSAGTYNSKTAFENGQAESNGDISKQRHNANASDAGSANAEDEMDADQDTEMQDAEDTNQEKEQRQDQDSDQKQATSSDSGAESGSDHVLDTIQVRSLPPPHLSSGTRTRSSQSQPQSQQNSPKQKKQKPQNSSQSQSHSDSQSQKSIQTPAVSKNPLRVAKTPANALTLSQLHAGTQANSSARRTVTNTMRSRVPDSVIEERPSPDLSVRRRPVSSPLGMLRDGHGEGKDEDEGEEGGNHKIEVNSPRTLDDPFVSARSDTQSPSGSASKSSSGSTGSSDSGTASGTSSRSASKSDSDSGSDETGSEDDDGGRRKTHNQADAELASQGSFWASVNGIAKRFVPGLSQGTRAQSQGQSQGKRWGLADALRQGAVDGSDSSDDE